MENQASIDLPITSESEFHTALCDLITSATENDVSIEGGWDHRCEDDDLPDFDIVISAVMKPIGEPITVSSNS
ncbi:hypothetical protein [Natronococcus pandeyae]|uniref:hypothetical protein n=1 Tax=Natronococcus pandeyae TaxID=2055836 RepID=UPI0011E7BB62|nr:hypothetical protein [Natronococcus pandeyae]